jgi:hypothetical protein
MEWLWYGVKDIQCSLAQQRWGLMKGISEF